MKLPGFLEEKYLELKPPIQKRLKVFSKVPPEDYFYELCFCICTPQSKAGNALKVEKKLRERDFHNISFDPVPILRNPDHYIRFHNQKSQRLLEAKEKFPLIMDMLNSEENAQTKRTWLVENVKGLGMKESSHFLRNIGCRNLAILDRHILKHLVHCRIFREIPKVNSIKQYLEIEKKFYKFALRTEIPLDELDLLFWSYETGEILK